MIKPKVFKMAGVWLWSCDHAGHVGDEFPAHSYRDPWCAAQAAAIKHYAQWHYSMGGAEVLDEVDDLT